MAAYYIDPHTATNGTGSWASPWSLSTGTRTGLVNGDELRIKGVALTSLLTATEYTFTMTSATDLTWVSGGSAADFAVYDIVYLPDYGHFFKVMSKGSTTIGVASSYCMLPIYNTQTASVSGAVKVRRVNTLTYGASSTTGPLYTAIGAVNNITLTDCWTADGTRVTDGTVKSLITSSFTSSSIAFYPDTTTAGKSGYIIDLPNTHVVHGNNSSTGSGVSVQFTTSNTVANIAQIEGQYSGWNGGMTIGSSGSPVSNTIITIGNFSGQGIVNYYGRDVQVNFANTAADVIDRFWRDGIQNGRNITVNMGAIVVKNGGNTSPMIYSLNSNNLTVNFNGIIDIYANEWIGCLNNGYGRANVSFHATNFAIKQNKRAGEQRHFQYKYYLTRSINEDQTRRVVPSIPNPPNVTNNDYSRRVQINSNPFDSAGTARVSNVPNVIHIDLPMTANNTETYPNWMRGMTGGTNYLHTFKDNSDPIEVLSPVGNGYFTSGFNNEYPVVTRDSTVYRTSAPSLKSYLATRTSAIWTSNNVVKTCTAMKSIKIPVTGNTSYTVTGYTRTDDSAVVNGDCIVTIVFEDDVVASQSMTTASYNAWEAFSLSFTPNKTGEAHFVWNMYYPTGAKSFWLDDLVIT